MTPPVPRRRWPERWRGDWPREFWDPFGEFMQLWNRMGQPFESAPATLRQRQGRFAYRTTLPADADLEKIDAQMGDGVLTVCLPKAAQARSRRIEIKS